MELRDRFNLPITSASTEPVVPAGGSRMDEFRKRLCAIAISGMFGNMVARERAVLG